MQRSLLLSLSFSVGPNCFTSFYNFWWCPFRPFCLIWLKFESFFNGVDFFLYVSLYAMCFWCFEAILVNGYFTILMKNCYDDCWSIVWVKMRRIVMLSWWVCALRESTYLCSTWSKPTLTHVIKFNYVIFLKLLSVLTC